MLCLVSHVQLFVTSRTVVCQAPLSMGILQVRILEWIAMHPVLLPPHAKRWLIGKDSDAGRDWEQEEKGTTG